jgi:hypothetical protein
MVGEQVFACVVLGPPDGVFIGVDHNPATPQRLGWTRSDLAPAWDPTTTGDPQFRAFAVDVGMSDSLAPIFADGFESGTTSAWSR